MPPHNTAPYLNHPERQGNYTLMTRTNPEEALATKQEATTDKLDTDFLKF